MNQGQTSTADSITLGNHFGYWFDCTPRRALYYLSYYKFASRLIGTDKQVLDIGCSEGLGTWLIAKECGFARGVDFDEDALSMARKNWGTQPEIDFICEDFLSYPGEKAYHAVVSFDVIQQIFPENIDQWWRQVLSHLTHDGMVIMGTPNVAAQPFATDVAKAGRVNIYSAEKMENELKRYFAHTFLFSANDEVIHTGFKPMSHYLLGVGCQPLKENYL